MYFDINEKKYKIEIIFKNNKNMYLRIKDDLSLLITAPRGTSKRVITNFVNSNLKYIASVLEEKEMKRLNEEGKLKYLGKMYDVCYINKNDVYLGDEKVFIGKNIDVDKWYRKRAGEIFSFYYDKCFDEFEDSFAKPVLKIRKMKSKWGVCNITNKTITLNLELIKYDYKYLEYVIFHELCHLKHHDHSKKFWLLVESYVPNYKQLRKEMKSI